MTVDQAVDWGLRIVMAGLTVLVFLWGRTQKQNDDLVESKAADLKRLVDHDRAALSALMESKAEGLAAAVSEKSHALARLFESELARRDERIAGLVKQLDDAAERASTAASKLTGKMGEVDSRLTILETQWKERERLHA